MKWIKKFFLKILSEVENHLAKCIAALILLASSGFLWFARRWVMAKHSLELYGGLWIVAFLTVSSVPILTSFMLKKRKNRISLTNEDDIKNLLELRFREFSRGCHTSKTRLTIKFNLFDKIANVKSGSSRKYLEQIANAFGYSTARRGDKTIVLEYKDQSAIKKPGFLDDLY